jgi:hypothetical protein
LDSWERNFATNIADLDRLSERQHNSLAKIIRKIERFARAKGVAA